MGGLFKKFPVFINLCLPLGVAAVLLLFFGKVLTGLGQKGELRYKIRELNRIVPPNFSYLTQPVELGRTHPRELIPYAFFYEKVTAYFPEQPDAWGMLGFCRYYQGDPALAEDAYRQAMELNPQFFWYPYDLGVIHFNSGDFEQAEELFQKALSCNPQIALGLLDNSRMIYRLILHDSGLTAVDIQRRLQEGYQSAKTLVQESQRQLRSPNIDNRLQHKLRLRNF